MSELKQLRIVIGPHAHLDDGFKMFLGDEEISKDMVIKSLSLKIGDPDPTLVVMEVYADSIEIIPDQANFHILPTTEDTESE